MKLTGMLYAFKINFLIILIFCYLKFSCIWVACHILASSCLRSILIEYLVWKRTVSRIGCGSMVGGLEDCVWECQSVYWIIELTAQFIYLRHAEYLSYIYLPRKYWIWAYLICRRNFYSDCLLENII